MAYYSRVVAIGDGSTTQFAVNFALDFINEEDVTCRVGTEIDGSGFPLYRPITFLSTNLIKVGGAAAGIGVQVLFDRTVPKESLLIDYNDGDQLDEDNLMTAQKQLMMAVHEVIDGRADADSTAAASAEQATIQAGLAAQALADTQAVAAVVENKADLASPTFTGIPRAPTAAATTRSTQLATTDYVQTALRTRPTFGPVAAPWPVFIGDSLFTNAHATTTIPSLIKAAMGWPAVNEIGVSGSTIADQAQIYGFQRTPSIVNPAGVWLGTNDVNLDGFENRATEQTSLEGLRALLCHLAIPMSKRVTAQAMTTAAGVWGNLGTSIDPNGAFSNTVGAVKRGVVTGRHVVVAGWANTSSTGTAAVIIGNAGASSGHLLADTLTFKRPVILTNSPGGVATTVIPFVRIYKNVGASFDSKMTVSVGATGSGGVGSDVFLSYVAGLSGSADEAMPLVLSFNLHNYTSAAEVAQGTNALRRERFNAGIGNIVDELNGLGLWVVPVDAKSVLWDTTLLDTDGLHPINSGNAAMTTAAVAALNSAVSYRQDRLSVLNRSALSDTVGSDLYNSARFVIENFRRQIKSRASLGSGFSVYNSGNLAVAASTVVNVPWDTKLYDVAGDFAGSVWTPTAGQVVLSAALTYASATDLARYEVWITKNGATYKRLQAALASGTGEIAVSGTVSDLASGTDYYGVVAFQTGGANTVLGSSLKSWFTGYSAY